MLKEYRISFSPTSPTWKGPANDERLIAIYYRCWNIHQAVERARKEFVGEKIHVMEVVDK